MTDTNAPRAVHEQTRRNLIAGMQSSANAHALYLLYAGSARCDGLDDLARLFERLATDELRHYTAQAELVELVGTHVDDLRAAREAEHYAVQTLLREYAAKASAAGDTDAAAVFARMRDDGRRHEQALRRALEAFESRDGRPG